MYYREFVKRAELAFLVARGRFTVLNADRNEKKNKAKDIKRATRMDLQLRLGLLYSASLADAI